MEFQELERKKEHKLGSVLSFYKTDRVIVKWERSKIRQIEAIRVWFFAESVQAKPLGHAVSLHAAKKHS